VARLKANVLEVHHNRAFLRGPIGETEIELTLETRGVAHVEDLVTELLGLGFRVTRRW
jgi:threonine dehydratase